MWGARLSARACGCCGLRGNLPQLKSYLRLSPCPAVSNHRPTYPPNKTHFHGLSPQKIHPGVCQEVWLGWGFAAVAGWMSPAKITVMLFKLGGGTCNLPMLDGGKSAAKGLESFCGKHQLSLTQKCLFFPADSQAAQRKVSPLPVSRFGQMNPLFGSSTEAGSCLHGAAHQNQGWRLPEMGAAGCQVWKGVEDPEKWCCS